MITEFLTPLINTLKGIVQVWGGIGVFMAMIVQAILVVIPSEGVLVAAGLLMNTWEVTVWAILGSISGASISFLIAKKGGRPIVKRLLGKETVSFMDNWVRKWGNKSVLIGRLIPFIPYDPISYLSGVTEMKFKKFTLYNTIGTIPRVILFTFIGSMINYSSLIGVIFIGGLLIGLLGLSIYTKKRISKERLNNQNVKKRVSSKS